MSSKALRNPFHEGELAAQMRAGAGDVARWAAGFIRDHMPDQHRRFYETLPFMVVAGEDHQGQIWVTLVEGKEGFITSPNARQLALDMKLDDLDPLKKALNSGADIGAIGIEPATRRRNRFSGHLKRDGSRFIVDIKQSFGNCPQYITERSWHYSAKNTPDVAVTGDRLTPSQRSLIEKSDTLFIGSGQQSGASTFSRGYDASHRGGAPGFVQVLSNNRLRIPDFSGNNFFNTIGNLIANPKIGLVFVDFETGGLLHVTGRAKIDWMPNQEIDPLAQRFIEVEICKIVERPSALALRWSSLDQQAHSYIVSKKVRESATITSFYLTPEDGRDLPAFKPGQHLPIEVQIPGHSSPIKRSYSLSGSPKNAKAYRLTIKREQEGLVSQFLHQEIAEGSRLHASAPSGTFTLPEADEPLILVSAGVGLTPMVSMLHAALAAPRHSPVWFVHSARNSTEHALRQEVEYLVSQSTIAQQCNFYTRPSKEDVLARRFDKQGRITVEDLLRLPVGERAHYRFCGPAGFVADLSGGLETAGVSPESIAFELFGARPTNQHLPE